MGKLWTVYLFVVMGFLNCHGMGVKFTTTGDEEVVVDIPLLRFLPDFIDNPPRYICSEFSSAQGPLPLREIITHDPRVASDTWVAGSVFRYVPPPCPYDQDRLNDEEYVQSTTQLDLLGIPEFFKGDIFKFKFLRVLNLGNCQLKHLPEEIGELTSLYFLNLCSNFLKELPTSFSNLTQIKYLDLSYNQWTQPPNLAHMNKLFVFSMRGFLWHRDHPFVINANQLKILDICFLTTEYANYIRLVEPFLEELVFKGVTIHWWINPTPYKTCITQVNMTKETIEGSNGFYPFIQNLEYPKQNPGNGGRGIRLDAYGNINLE